MVWAILAGNGAPRTRLYFASVLLGVPRVLRWLFMCNKLICLCVQHDAIIGTCLLGVGGVVVAKNMAL